LVAGQQRLQPTGAARHDGGSAPRIGICHLTDQLRGNERQIARADQHRPAFRD
jgi:hypothetical protein